MFTKNGPHYNEKVERNKAIYRLHKVCPKMRYKQIGFIFGVTPQAVSKIIKREAESVDSGKAAVN
jgi:hypothetical protein